MNTSGINSSLPYVYTSPFASAGASTSISQNNAPASPSAVQGHQDHDADDKSRGGLAQTVMQALQQSGVDVTSSSGKHAVHELMHDIFQAVQQGSSSSQPNPPKSSTHSTASGYDQASTNLQSLIQQLGTNSSSSGSQNSALTKLQADFNAVVQSVGGASATQGAASLQNFLGNLSKDLSAQGGSKPPAGSLINVAA